jgi:hypothetical protein
MIIFITSFLYVYNNTKFSYSRRYFAEAEYLIPEILNKLKIHNDHLDEHRNDFFTKLLVFILN